MEKLVLGKDKKNNHYGAPKGSALFFSYGAALKYFLCCFTNFKIQTLKIPTIIKAWH